MITKWCEFSAAPVFTAASDCISLLKELFLLLAAAVRSSWPRSARLTEYLRKTSNAHSMYEQNASSCTFILHLCVNTIKSQTSSRGDELFSVRCPLYLPLSLTPWCRFSLLYITSWKCPVLLGGWLCHMWNIRHLIIGFVIKCFCLVDRKGRNIPLN